MPHTLSCHQSTNADHAQLYEILVKELTDFVVFLIDPTGCIVSWNPAVEHIFGYKEAEWLGQPAEIIFTPEDQAQKTPQKEFAIATEKQCARDVRWHVRKNGERLYVEGSLIALRSPEGTLLGFSKVMRDITERQQIEDSLRTAETHLRALIAASSDVLYRMNCDWTEMHQLGGGGFIADTDSSNKDWLRQYIHPDDQSLVLEAVQKAIQTKGVFDLEHRVLRIDQTLGWTHSRAVPLFDNDGNITEWFGAASDITPRKEAEAARELYLAKLARSNEDLSQFAHVLSHDLKTPIRGIKSFSELLRRRYENQLDTTGQEYLGLIQGSVDSMHLLIETLLGYAVVGQKVFSPQLVPLAEVLKTVVDSLQPIVEETAAAIDFQELPIVLGDRSLLEQLLQNLVSNALKYRKPNEAPHIRVQAQSSSEDWLISVRDNGEGIDSRYYEQIFAPFTRLHGAEREGSGIGLATCKRIVERHGGAIWVNSELGQGATFFFTLSKNNISEPTGTS